MRIQFATQSYKSKAAKVSTQRCVNMYAAIQPKDAKSEVAVFGSPGITEFATCGTGPVRGMHLLGGVVHAVSGGTLYSVAENGTVASLGSTISGSGPVSMDDNAAQLAIVNGTNGYIYSVAAGFQLITDADFHSANTVQYFNGRFAFDRTGTNEFFISDTDDGTAFSDFFASAEWKSDNVRAVVNHLQNLYVLGEKTTEPYYFSGAANFPFQRIEGGAIDRGVIGSHAAKSAFQKLFFVGDDRVAYRLSGGAAAPMSTDAVNEEWQGYAQASDAQLLTFTFEGRRFVYITFPSANTTFVFDDNTGLLHERESWDQNGRSLGRWRGNCAIEAYGKVLIGDQFSGRIGYLDKTTFTEFGNTIQAEVVSPPIHGDGKRCFMPMFELDIQSGVGLTSGQGSDPQVMLSISDDGGKTYGDQQPWRSMGKIGEYTQRLRWDRLGSFYDRRLKIMISDPVPRTIIAARCPEMHVGI